MNSNDLENDLDENEVCSFCHKTPAGGWFARLRREGDAVQFCSPSCMITFLERVERRQRENGVGAAGASQAPIQDTASDMDNPDWYDINAGMELQRNAVE